MTVGVKGSRLLGALLAGGEGRRMLGRRMPGQQVSGINASVSMVPKPLVSCGGKSLATWGLEALAAVCDHVGIISYDGSLSNMLSVPVRPDLRPGLGPVAGLEAALAWARDEGCEGVLLLGCDMPLVQAPTLRSLRANWSGSGVVVPQSTGPLGYEPLCGIYGLQIVDIVRAFLDSGRRSMEGLLGELEPTVLSPSGTNENTFLNVNTPQELARVEELMRESV